MAYKELKTRIKWCRDTSANWTSNNPVLLDGEIIVVDTDSGETRFKIGDGVKTYTQLPFEDEAVRNLINNKSNVDHKHTKDDIKDFPNIPTKTSELVNDSGFKTTDDNITYSINKVENTVILEGSDGSTSSFVDNSVTIKTWTSSDIV